MMFFTKLGLLSVFHLYLKTWFLAEAQIIPNLSPTVSRFQTNRVSVAPTRGLLFRQRQVLNALTGTILEWEMDPQRRENSTITFTFTTNTANLNDNENTIILLGLSRTGQVDGADVAAVTLNNVSDQQAQLVDMHGVSNTSITPDARQNWRLISTQRNSSQVSFIISRILNTCDQQDVAIDNNLLRIIWGYSNSPSAEDGFLNFIPEGSKSIYLLDPVIPTPTSQPGNAIQTWRVARTFHVPPRRTSYWCTFHRGLPLSRKHHIVGFSPYFKDAESEQHVHHKLVYRCSVPPGVDGAKIFDRFVGHPGEECYLEETHRLPTVFCTEIMMVWSRGGTPFYLPNDVGLVLGETRNEYFMFETHYDNPESRSDLVVENGVDFLYSQQLRPNEGNVIFFSHGLLGLFQIPPHANDFTVAGHCGSQCTNQMIPQSGMQIVATMLHSHTAGRKLTLRYFRGNRELPWIQSDNNYDFNFQPMRLLPQPVNILPGDHLTLECVMDTSDRNSTTASGFATTDEMCMVFTIVTKRLSQNSCSSEYPVERSMARYGVTNMTWTREGQERVVHAANNRQFVGLPYTRVVDQSVGTWTPQRIRELEREQLYQPHDMTCPPFRDILNLGHFFELIEDVTIGLVPTGVIVDYFRATTRSIRTPLIPGLMYTTYPSDRIIYTPPPTCSA